MLIIKWLAVEAGRQNPENERQLGMRILMRWLPIAASLALACVPATSAAPAARNSRQTSSSSASSPSKPSKHKKSRKKRRSKRMHLPKAPTPDRISEIQTALSRGGYYQGDPNGKWDAKTVDAMQKFQTANSLEPSGKLDAPSLQKLGLGSDIAGVSAPKPVMPPSCCGDPPSSAAPPPSAPSAPAPSGNSSPAGHTSTSSPAASSASRSSPTAGAGAGSSAAAPDPQH